MRECQAQGCNVILITREKMLHEDWPVRCWLSFFAVPNDAPVELFFDWWRAILRKRERSIASSRSEEFDVSIAARRASTCALKGMSSVTAQTPFRDKLSMSVKARDAGITVPDRPPASSLG